MLHLRRYIVFEQRSFAPPGGLRFLSGCVGGFQCCIRLLMFTSLLPDNLHKLFRRLFQIGSLPVFTVAWWSSDWAHL
jgi:hypothetical protein